MMLQRFLDEFQRRGRVTGLGDIRLQHLALVVDGSPEVSHLAVDADGHLVEVPAPVGELAHVRSRSRRISPANIGPNRASYRASWP
jgi:hypothetical protein